MFHIFISCSKYILSSYSGYPNWKGFLAPYKNNPYNLPDFAQEGLPTKKEEIFIYAHARIWNAIERNFGILKNKWAYVEGYPFLRFGYTEENYRSLHCASQFH
jgi:hypothetical protein